MKGKFFRPKGHDTLSCVEKRYGDKTWRTCSHDWTATEGKKQIHSDQALFGPPNVHPASWLHRPKSFFLLKQRHSNPLAPFYANRCHSTGSRVTKTSCSASPTISSQIFTIELLFSHLESILCIHILHTTTSSKPLKYLSFETSTNP